MSYKWQGALAAVLEAEKDVSGKRGRGKPGPVSEKKQQE